MHAGHQVHAGGDPFRIPTEDFPQPSFQAVADDRFRGNGPPNRAAEPAVWCAAGKSIEGQSILPKRLSSTEQLFKPSFTVKTFGPAKTRRRHRRGLRAVTE